MRIVINGLEPCPRNRSHTIVNRGKFPQMIKTEAARLYEQALRKLLEPYEMQKDKFISSFDEDKHGIVATYYHGTPDLFTKTGKINLRSVDLDAHKVLKDVIAQFFGIDDGYILKEVSTKLYSKTHTLIVRYEIIDKDISYEIDMLGCGVH